MSTRLVIEENAVYEIDEECMRQQEVKRKENGKEKQKEKEKEQESGKQNAEKTERIRKK